MEAGPSSGKRHRHKVAEDELEETFLHGSGPGGQKINKTQSRVRLVHAPTGLTVVVQDTRSREANRTIARKRLADKVEAQLKGNASRLGRKAQRKRRRKAKAAARARRKYADAGDAEAEPGPEPRTDLVPRQAE
ncbi:peptide release factor [Thecamonas trahens ATCC 50062]|uniref:Peptide release factor n=1 Tax=Thecamonas trahens ATCC 50062 TaxID=461836 RepID=A0A0L0DGI0_THETB|nr:peptide release factor [Thecamonas trahens ATCC 50062]KNC51439.1 peptide release factor [Thecamonas trahens ATCC 50062]|eukprot:XP_013756102.1 peptide release factor [Thecamonas trahens ATCC 50062]